MMQTDLMISCRQKDAALVKKAASTASAEFAEAAGFPIKFEVVEDLAPGR